MKENYILDCIDEAKFKKLERSLKRYNIVAYKKLYFEFYPALKEGNFLGELVEVDESKDMKRYKLKLPTDSMFVKVHGSFIELHYIVYENEKTVMLDTIKPEEILNKGHQSELETYKGVMTQNSRHYKDMFKINLLNSICNSEKEKKCKKCHKSLEDDYKFCPYCGNKV